MKVIRNLKIEHVLVFALVILLLVGNVQKISDPDVWWHLKVGTDIIETGNIPYSDTYTFSNLNHPWVAHEWLAEVIYAFVYKNFGFYGMVFVNVLIMLITFTMLYICLKHRSHGNLILSVALTIFSVIILSNFWTFRPHMMAYLCFMAFLFILELYSRGRDFLWILPFIMLFWVNVHGSFVLGVILLVVYLISHFINVDLGRLQSTPLDKKKKQKLIFILLIVGAITVLNPNGYNLWIYPFETANSTNITEYIEEWNSPDFHQLRFQMFFLLMAIVYMSLLVSREKIKVYDVLILLMFSFLTMYGGRNMALFALACTPMAAGHYGKTVPNRSILQYPLLNWLVLLGLFMIGAVQLPQANNIEAYAEPKREPVEAVRYMEKHNLKGNVFNDYNWGGYLIWTRAYQNPVFIDGRTDMFTDKVLPDYINIVKIKRDAYKTLMSYEPNYILISTGHPLNEILKFKGEWTLIYQDQTANLYERRGSDIDQQH